MRPARRDACVWLGSWGRSRSFLVVLQQLGHAVGELGSVAGPVLDAVLLQQHACRARPRVVSANDFNRTTIARTILLDHDYSVIRLLARSKARQTNHQHRISVPFSILFRIVSGLSSGLLAIASHGGTDGVAPVLLPTHQVWRNQWFSASRRLRLVRSGMVNGRPETNRYARIENSMACSTASWLANIAHPRHRPRRLDIWLKRKPETIVARSSPNKKAKSLTNRQVGRLRTFRRNQTT